MNQSKPPSAEKRVEKLQIMVADSELSMIDDWRFENRAASRSAAIRTLVFLGIEMAKADPGLAKKCLGKLERE